MPYGRLVKRNMQPFQLAFEEGDRACTVDARRMSITVGIAIIVVDVAACGWDTYGLSAQTVEAVARRETRARLARVDRSDGHRSIHFCRQAISDDEIDDSLLRRRLGIRRRR